MSYKILPTKEFSKDYKKRSPDSSTKIRQKIEEIASDPTRYKRLHYQLKDSSRARIGKYRIIFSYDRKREELYLEKIVFKHKY